MACFADINVSQGSAATRVRYGGSFNIHLTANLPRNLLVKKVLKSVKNWQNYGHESVTPFFGPTCGFNFVVADEKASRISRANRCFFLFLLSCFIAYFLSYNFVR